MTWRRVEMAEALRWFAQKYLRGVRATTNGTMEGLPETRKGPPQFVVLSDGSMIAAASDWWVIDTKAVAQPPEFWVGEP